MEYKIRRVRTEDFENTQSLATKLCVNENKKFDPTVNPDYYLTDEGREGFRRFIRSDFSAVFVAEVGGKIIGYLAGGVVDAENFRNIKRLCKLENLWIDEEYRGKGIGKELVENFEKWCREKNVFRLRVNASASNEKAIEFYRKTGFENHELILEKPLD